jgi:hypothetical protein
MFARLQQKKLGSSPKGMQRDHILGKWIARTYRAEPRHVGYLLRALPSQDKDTLLMRVYAELSGGGDPQYHGYTVDPYSPYGRHQPQQRATPPGSWPPAQAVQQQQQQQQQWTTQSSIGKTVMADLDRQRTAQAVQAVLRSDSHTIKCYAQCSLSWRFGSGCNVWSGGRCSNAAATILKDEQGQYLDANSTAMEAKIQQMSHEEGSITSTAPLIPQAGNVARQEEDTQGFICVCQDHADKIAEWAQSSLPSLGLKLAALGVAAYGGKKLYSMATANKERDEATREYELIQKTFRNLAQTQKNTKVALLLQQVKNGTPPLAPAQVTFLRENGMTLDTAPTEDGACTWAGQAPASPAEQMLQQTEKERKKLEETQLEAALIAYKDKVLSHNPEGLPWQEALKDSPTHIQALLGSAEIRAGLGL